MCVQGWMNERAGQRPCCVASVSTAHASRTVSVPHACTSPAVGWKTEHASRYMTHSPAGTQCPCGVGNR